MLVRFISKRSLVLLLFNLFKQIFSWFVFVWNVNQGLSQHIKLHDPNGGGIFPFLVQFFPFAVVEWWWWWGSRRNCILLICTRDLRRIGVTGNDLGLISVTWGEWSNFRKRKKKTKNKNRDEGKKKRRRRERKKISVSKSSILFFLSPLTT